MRQLFLEKGALAIKEVCRPFLDDYSVLISVSYSFMGSGNELSKIIRHNQGHFLKNVPAKIKRAWEIILHQGGTQAQQLWKDRVAGRVLPIGYSCSGRVLTTGKKVKHCRVGDFVACAGDGLANHAEIVCVPETLVVQVPHERLLRAASLTGVGAIALQSIRRSGVALGEMVCVVGADTLGQLIIQLAHIAGCRVMVIDKIEAKLEEAKKAGAEFTYQVDSKDLKSSIDYITKSHGVDCTIITPECIHDGDINLAIAITRKQGRIVLVGNKAITLKQESIQRKELNIVLSLAYGPGRYDAEYEYQGRDYPFAYVRWTENRNMNAFIDLLKTRRLNVDYLIDQEIRLDGFENRLKAQLNDNGKGFVISYDPAKKDLPCAEKTQSFIPAHKIPNEKINVTFFGASRFARLTLMPIINNIKNIEVHKIIDRDISRALNAAKQYIGAYPLSGDPELFYNDPVADVVCITSTYNLHVEHILKALKNGKAVYLHRPIPFEEEGVNRLKEYLSCNPSARFCVGYHRSYAPFVKKIKGAIAYRRSPLMINYRLNLSAIEDRDTIDKRPRHGNVVDKASHVFDLFYFLTEAKPLSVCVETLRPARENIYASDNFACQISFSDGSICSLQVSSLGHPDNGVERMELHFDGKSIVVEDFIGLTGFGFPRSFDELIRVPDKGRETCLRTFFENVTQSERSPLFDPLKLEVVANLTTQIDRLVCQGGGEARL